MSARRQASPASASSCFLFAHFTGHYYIIGGGYDAIAAILEGHVTTFALLAVLCLAQVLATSLSIGSGASGGVFAPMLFIGAALGGAFGAFLHLVDEGHGIGIPDYAIIGMAAVVGGGTGAAMTAITMNFEMTRDYNIIVPLIIAVAISIGVRRGLMRDNIFSAELVRRGRPVPKDRYSNLYLVRSAREVMDSNIAVMSAELSVADAASMGDGSGHAEFPRAAGRAGASRASSRSTAASARRNCSAASPKPSATWRYPITSSCARTTSSRKSCAASRNATPSSPSS